MTVPQIVRYVLQAMVEKPSVEYKPRQVILFGSYAYGVPGPDSDVDLLIIKDTSERFIERWMSVRRVLSDPKRTLPLKTLVLTPEEVAGRLRAGDQFLKEILEKGEVPYGA